MRVLFDTSVLVAALRPGHPHHARCRPHLDRVRAGADVGLLSAHTLAELYATLTRLPPTPSAPADAESLIRREVTPHFTPVPLDGPAYLATLADAAARGESGSIVHDAVICRAGIIGAADRLLTLNVKHFLRVWPGPPGAAVAP